MSEATFVWHELTTVDPLAAKAFYPKLFGWTFRDQDMGPSGTYTLWMAGERGVGGMMAIDKSHGFPSQWYGYVSVPDVDAAARRAGQLGAQVMVPPTDIPQVGRFALFQDPHGAVLAVMKPEGPDMADEKQHAGEFCWDELHAVDPKAAAAFYGEIVGWKVRSQELGGAFGQYHVFQAGERDRAGMMHARDGKTAWLGYVAVDDVDAMAKKAEALGAKVVAKPADIPSMGRYAFVVDPTGARFALWKAFPHK